MKEGFRNDIEFIADLDQLRGIVLVACLQQRSVGCE